MADAVYFVSQVEWRPERNWSAERRSLRSTRLSSLPLKTLTDGNLQRYNAHQNSGVSEPAQGFFELSNEALAGEALAEFLVKFSGDHL
ncbi:hypothetical protein GCM10028799_14350 [Kribbella italica]